MDIFLDSSGYEGTYEAIAGHSVIDFANTISNRRSPREHEWLDSYTNLLAWCGLAGLLDSAQIRALQEKSAQQPRNSKNVLADARRLREAIYSLIADAASSREPHPEVLQVFNDYLTRATAQGALQHSSGKFAWQSIPQDPSLEAMLWPLARSAADLLLGPELTYVGECEGEGCGWLFIDESRNHSRRWCNMNDCGNRAKAKRHYQRAKAAS
ncbi:MAG: hypothetical protein DWG76_02560 [Chloroflexi bacterium]|nr:hypothetical protein [Chloroflexota bacterium]